MIDAPCRSWPLERAVNDLGGQQTGRENGGKEEVFYQRGESFAIKISLLRTGASPVPRKGGGEREGKSPSGIRDSRKCGGNYVKAKNALRGSRDLYYHSFDERSRMRAQSRSMID